MRFVTEYLDDLSRTISGLNPDDLERAVSLLREARDDGRMIFVCGNGGSASIASQMVVDMAKGASYGMSSRFKIMGLADSIATITAYANDVSYDSVFVEQLRNFARRGDVLLAISSSGNSSNVLRAVEYANDIGCRTIALTRANGGLLKDLVQLTLAVPNTHTGRLEDCFFAITHILAYAFIENADHCMTHDPPVGS